MRSPLQGGLPPVRAVAGPVVEIACDESGFSGTDLVRSAAPLITHASVDLSADEAGELVAALRVSPHELKSGRFLRRPDAAAARERFLVALRGRARVHVVDKEFFLVTRVVDLLLGEHSYAAGTRLTGALRPMAVALHAGGRAAGSDWDEFLSAFAGLARSKRRPAASVLVARFLGAREALLRRALSSPAEAVVAGFTPDRVRVLVARLDAEDRSLPPPLEPLLPALAETVLTWSDGWRRVLVVHDEQSALTADRLTRLQRALTGADGLSPLAGLVMTDSRDEPRVQVADLLAGVARRTSGDPLLGPLLTPTSWRGGPPLS